MHDVTGPGPNPYQVGTFPSYLVAPSIPYIVPSGLDVHKHLHLTLAPNFIQKDIPSTWYQYVHVIPGFDVQPNCSNFLVVA